MLFQATEQSSASLAAWIEGALSERFGYQSRIVLRSQTQMQAVIDDAPAGFGSELDVYRYDVVHDRCAP